MPLHRCASPACPGYTVKASDRPHPLSTCGAPVLPVEAMATLIQRLLEKGATPGEVGGDLLALSAAVAVGHGLSLEQFLVFAGQHYTNAVAEVARGKAGS